MPWCWGARVQGVEVPCCQGLGVLQHKGARGLGCQAVGELGCWDVGPQGAGCQSSGAPGCQGPGCQDTGVLGAGVPGFWGAGSGLWCTRVPGAMVLGLGGVPGFCTP